VEVDATFETVSTTERKRATYADLEALPENVLGQLIDGELIALPHPGNAHHFVASRLLGLLGARGFGDTVGWWLLFRPELHLGEDVLVPDLAGWRGASLPEKDRRYFTVAPDWICEVLSPSTARLDRDRKLPLYARAGVGHAWLLDPETRTLEVFRRAGPAWEVAGTFAADAPVRAEPFEAVELDLARLWAWCGRRWCRRPIPAPSPPDHPHFPTSVSKPDPAFRRPPRHHLLRYAPRAAQHTKAPGDRSARARDQRPTPENINEYHALHNASGMPLPGPTRALGARFGSQAY
jgi:Uma2 family endonuclease